MPDPQNPGDGDPPLLDISRQVCSIRSVSDSQPLLQVSGLTKRFNNLTAVDSVSLEVFPGEIFALLGPNGAGKTTMIGCIGGLQRDFEGDIRVAGYDVRAHPRITRQVVGIVPQELNFDSFFNARQVLEYQSGFFGLADRRERARELLRDFGLESKAEANSRWLSGGMKRRLMICKALVHRPALLFLDEPTAGVDVELRDELWAYVRRLRDSGVTIFLTTHYLEEAEQLADRIGILHEGRLALVDTRENLLQRYGQRWLRVHFSAPVATDLAQAASDLSPEVLDPTSLRIDFQSPDSDGNAVTAAIDRFRLLADPYGATLRDFESGRSSLEDVFRRILRERRDTPGTDLRPANTPVPRPGLPDSAIESARTLTARVIARAGANHGGRGTLTLLRRELHRIISVAGQSLISPALTTFLWFLVFGFSLGDRIQDIDGIRYMDFLVPGLVMMALITNSFLNSSFGFFITKIHGSVTDLLLSPLTALQVAFSYVTAAVLRGACVAAVIWLVAALMGASTFHDPLLTVAFAFFTTVGFASLGLITAVFARDFEHINFIPNFLLVPFTFLGGVFYSIRMLPSPWDSVSLFNPIIYMVNGLRYGMTGISDVPVASGLLIAAFTAAAGFLSAVLLLASGRRLRE